MSDKEKVLDQYNPQQKLFRKMRDSLSVVYQKELWDVIRHGTADWEATITVDLIASYYEKYIPPKEQKEINSNTKNKPDYLKLRAIALAVGIKQNEMLKEIKKGRLRDLPNETKLTTDHNLVLEAVLLVDQFVDHLNRA